jgi:hypothetical protein
MRNRQIPGVAWSLLLACAGLHVAGCFPYREVYRPAMSGAVFDEGGTPIEGAQVVSCSETHWQRMSGCPRSATMRTTSDGAFHFERLTEWDWCCLGEAPLPHTVVVACSPDGRLALGAPAADPMRLVLVAPPEKVAPESTGPVDRCRAELRVLPRQ